MRPTTDYIEHLGRLARKLHLESAMGGPPPQADSEFYKVLAKATEEIVQALKVVSVRE
jgi:hypothetical protein